MEAGTSLGEVGGFATRAWCMVFDDRLKSSGGFCHFSKLSISRMPFPLPGAFLERYLVADFLAGRCTGRI
jgi:hypothetical protein